MSQCFYHCVNDVKIQLFYSLNSMTTGKGLWKYKDHFYYMMLCLSKAFRDLMVGAHERRSLKCLNAFLIDNIWWKSIQQMVDVPVGRVVLRCLPICFCTFVRRNSFGMFSWVGIGNWPRGFGSSFRCMDGALSMVRIKS